MIELKINFIIKYGIKSFIKQGAKLGGKSLVLISSLFISTILPYSFSNKKYSHEI